MSTLQQEAKSYNKPVTLPIICRPEQSYWVLVMILVVALVMTLILGLGLVVSRKLLVDGIALVGFAAIVLFLIFLYGRWLARATIIADANGLHWRGLGRWQVAAWHEVTDYYLQLRPATQALNIVECGVRHLSFSSDIWNEESCRRLQNAIMIYATEARTTDWQVLGTRSALDWTGTFRYDTRENRWKVHQVSISLTLITLVVFFPWHLSYSTIWWKAISFGSIAGSLAWLTFKMCVIWKVKQAAYRRFDEQIAITGDGICWEKQNASIAASWDEVTDYFIVSSERGLIPRVVTTRGNIDFHPSIQDYEILKRLITTQALRARTRAWRTLRYMEALGGVAAKWSSGREGVGDRIYHYRTRSNRSRMWIWTVIALMLFVIIFLLFVIDPPIPGTPAAGAANVLFAFVAFPGILVLWGWYRYRTASVRTNVEGIMQYTPFGKKHIAWNDVFHFYMSDEGSQRYDEGGSYGNVIGPNIRIQFWIGIADIEDLKEEIAHRAIHATGNWNQQKNQKLQKMMSY